MGKRDEYDDDEDDRAAKPPRGGLPPALMVLLAVGGGFLFLATAAGLGLLVLAGTPTVESRPTQTEPVGKRYTRDEFRKLVVGKTTEEVLAAIGKPESTSSSSPQHQLWVYRSITVDPVTKETDFGALVTFRNGKATDVSY